MSVLSKAQIGRCGELLVQYRLLQLGIESSPMTTDSGIDLVVYSPKLARAQTVQVKANHRPKPSGGKGQLALDWWLREDSPAELVALVDLSLDRVWLFRHAEVTELAQQRSNGSVHLYFYVDADYQPRSPGTHINEFARFELRNRIEEIFGIKPLSMAEAEEPLS